MHFLLPRIADSDYSVSVGVTAILTAAGICRLHYFRVKAPLPALYDVDGRAAYWKAHYNTPLGAGTVEEFKTSFIALTVAEAWPAYQPGASS